MQKLPVYQVDAFSDKPFEGNPAAVMPLREWLSDEVLQQIAMENNLSETAFFVPLLPNEMKTTGAEYHIRWFTPDMEVDLCGHATLASAMVINQILHLETKFNKITFITEKAGLLQVNIDEDWYTLDLPSRMPEPIATPNGLLAALGIEKAVRVLKSRDLLVVLENEEQVNKLAPDFAALSKIDCFGIIVTAHGENFDVVSRCFYPKAGINEDPVTGSAHCSIIPYWAEKLGKSELVCKQASSRGGTLVCMDRGPRVWMSGKCYLFMEGTVMLP
jgi:PhzF family phenazine biosynthesis protein